jgi:Ca-activated chloride channel family protein
MKSLAAGLLLFLSAGATPDDTDRVESLLFNPRERTGSGIEALENGDLETAVEHLETAHRLDNGSPITAFNVGTARLLAGDENAANRLEEAAAIAPQFLQPAALYNLGNAKLAAQDPAAAVDAYKQVLRLDQSHMEAKFNLEVAQRLLDEQQKKQQQDQQQQQDSSEQEEQQQQQGDQQQSQEPEQEDPSEEQEGSGQEEEEQQPEPQTGPEQERKQPLPGFENQEDMTAEQAAAILEAVENLEREQRKQQAEERARRRSKSGKDW